ncbi:sensor histidine kinase [Paraburkholderia kururiensis]|jgi:C4-dicarboxylate-specific signal transduction histidine kinase|uniref:histidine kinase n=1 Tax=Paraburkholderia kururiensis TaxID=984307 RepID=A0ABZ0WLR8_9BURK|nr:ATP-binding protein [Paraburkholderia kururiensis]WQD78299.1 ATP-binding protein [Paraburkholderia kururiensis]
MKCLLALLPVTIAGIVSRRRNSVSPCKAARVATCGEMAAMVAHELGQPLAAIGAESAAALNWLGRDSPDIDNTLSCLRRITTECQRAAEIIRHLRALTMRTPPHVAPLFINDVVEEVLPLVRRELLHHDVTLTTRLDPDLRPALGDRVQLAQVIVNLVMNGIQAMERAAGPERELVIESRGDCRGHVIVAVRDSGVGICTEQAQRLFEPFFTTKPDGLGLGLSICRAIIQSLGGEISMRNNDGPGATVEFSVPTASAVPCGFGQRSAL